MYVLIRPKTSLIAWLMTAMGLMGFACGGVLVSWSLWSDRGELWNLGLPIALGGQSLLALGLLLQLDRVWRASHLNSDQLGEFNTRLSTLRHDTSQLSRRSPGEVGAFYSHLSQSASPHVLVADLKGQLDMLQREMSDRV